MFKTKNKHIQALFTSQDIDPGSVRQTILNLLEYKLKSKFSAEYRHIGFEGLYRMFSHSLYAPVELFIDFSKGKEKNKCLIGKGVLYDSGGYNIKKDASDMHQDRFGALTAVLIAKRLKLPVRVFLVVNLVNEIALLPGTIIDSRLGKKVRVVDTDAEGRIGLAQLIENSSDYSQLISFATLTGFSAAVAGAGHSEVFTKNTKLKKKIISFDNKIVGLGHYFDDYKKGLYKNKILENLNSSYREAGASKAYAFLNEFLKEGQNLTHFDIAGCMEEQFKDYRHGLKEYCKIINSI